MHGCLWKFQYRDILDTNEKSQGLGFLLDAVLTLLTHVGFVL